MNSSSSVEESSGEESREARLNEILATYLQEKQRGETPDRQTLMFKHAEFAADLVSFFGDQDRFQQAVSPIKFAALAVEPTMASSVPPVLPAGQRLRYFGDYEVIEEIARGGMGVVYRARQVNLNRMVALKMILAGQLATSQEVQRFYAEAEAAAKLAHPNIVPIFEVGQYEQQHYFSMAFVDGESLARRIAQSVLEPRAAAALLKEVASAIAYAHVEGVIHRDLKPGNILIDKDGTPRVTDFGLAKQIEGDTSGLTVTGQVLGTPSYMPPEQARGDSTKITQLSDIYSLGAVLYCTLTGRPPFQAANPAETLMQLLTREPVSPRQLNSVVPRDLETICLKCLEKEPARRYSSAQELADELRRFLDNCPIHARPINRVERTWRWCHRNPAMGMLIGAVAASLLLVMCGLVWHVRQLNERQVRLLIAQSGTLRVAGERRGSLEAVSEAASLRRNFDVRRAAIEAITEPGTMLLKSIPFGRSGGYTFNEGGSRIAIFGDVNAWAQNGETRTGKVRVFDVDSGKLLNELDWRAGSDAIEPTFSPNADILAVPQQPGQMELWNFSTGEITKLLKVESQVDAMRFSPDGKFLALAGPSSTVLCELETDKQLQPDRPSQFLCFTSPNRVMLKQGDWKRKDADPPLIVAWNLVDKTFETISQAGLNPLAVSRDGNWLAAVESRPDAGPNRVAIYSLPMEKSEPKLVIDGGSSHYAARFSGDGRYLAIQDGMQPEIVSIWSVAQRKLIRTCHLPELSMMPMPMGWVGYVGGYRTFPALSPHARQQADFVGTGPLFYALPGFLGRMNVWHVESGEHIVVSPKTRWFAWSRDGRRLITDGEVRFDLYANGQSFAVDSQDRVLAQTAGPIANDARPPRNLTRNGTFGLAAEIRELVWPTTLMHLKYNYGFATTAFRADGKQLAINNYLFDIDRDDGHLSLQQSPMATDDGQVRFAGSDQTWVINHPWKSKPNESGEPHSTIRERDQNSWELKRLDAKSTSVMIRLKTSSSVLAISPDGRHAIVATYDENRSNVFQFWDIAAPDAPVSEWPAAPYSTGNELGMCVFSPDGKTFLTTAFESNSGMSLWDVATRKQLWKRQDWDPRAAFSSNGKWICLAAYQAIVVCDAHSGEDIVRCPVGDYYGETFALSPDNETLATGGKDQLITLWSLPSGKRLSQWEAHGDAVSSLAFSPDGKSLVSSGSDGTRKLWNLAFIHRELQRLNLDW